jgi:hypothetical protein
MRQKVPRLLPQNGSSSKFTLMSKFGASSSPNVQISSAKLHPCDEPTFERIICVGACKALTNVKIKSMVTAKFVM